MVQRQDDQPIWLAEGALKQEVVNPSIIEVLKLAHDHKHGHSPVDAQEVEVGVLKDLVWIDVTGGKIHVLLVQIVQHFKHLENQSKLTAHGHTRTDPVILAEQCGPPPSKQS